MSYDNTAWSDIFQHAATSFQNKESAHETVKKTDALILFVYRRLPCWKNEYTSNFQDYQTCSYSIVAHNAIETQWWLFAIIKYESVEKH